MTLIEKLALWVGWLLKVVSAFVTRPVHSFGVKEEPLQRMLKGSCRVTYKFMCSS